MRMKITPRIVRIRVDNLSRNKVLLKSNNNPMLMKLLSIKGAYIATFEEIVNGAKSIVYKGDDEAAMF